jgi:hypothetical protein
MVVDLEFGLQLRNPTSSRGQLDMIGKVMPGSRAVSMASCQRQV